MLLTFLAIMRKSRLDAREEADACEAKEVAFK